jgi:pyridoxamine 5'-phosphate oxidase
MRAYSMTISDLRREYTLHGLNEADVLADPIEQFQVWFNQALAAGVTEPNAMTLATSKPDGRPSARIVLLKHFDANGFLFFTNYRSRKGGELARNPAAALLFFWPPLERQVRIEGTVTFTTAEESDTYFRSRPLDSRLGACASPQSDVVADRAELEQLLADVRTRCPGDDVPRPPHWGGYRVTPDLFEFWQGRPGRLHDRLEYYRADGAWRLRRLAP